MNFSIIIPTYNRPELLLRLLRYYSLAEFGGKLLIADSSDKEIYDNVKLQTDTMREKLDIHHYHFPNRTVSEAIFDACQYLDTNYVCLLPDDDFIIPRTVVSCMDFLENNPEFVGAHGLGALVSSKEGRADRIDGACFYPQTVSLDASPSERFKKHLRNYSVSLFSVFRKDAFSKLFKSTIPDSEEGVFSDKSFKDELLPCCLSVLLGKIGQVDGLYLVRQVHNQRYILKNWFQWISGPEWSNSYKFFKGRLSRQLCILEGLSMDEADNIIDSSFTEYLSGSISSQRKKHKEKYQFLKKIGLHGVLRFCRDKFAVHMSPDVIVSLASLTDPASPHTSEFQLVKQVIGNETII